MVRSKLRAVDAVKRWFLMLVFIDKDLQGMVCSRALHWYSASRSNQPVNLFRSHELAMLCTAVEILSLIRSTAEVIYTAISNSWDILAPSLTHDTCMLGIWLFSIILATACILMTSLPSAPGLILGMALLKRHWASVYKAGAAQIL